jgi:hypothetical protein
VFNQELQTVTVVGVFCAFSLPALVKLQQKILENPLFTVLWVLVFIFYIDNNKKIPYRDAYKKDLKDTTDDLAFWITIDCWTKNFTKRNRDLSALVTLAFYALNIIDANVDAALIQFNVDENLSIRPVLYPNDVTLKTNVGLTFNYIFRAKAIRCFVV